jgi:hypothetical protein
MHINPSYPLSKVLMKIRFTFGKLVSYSFKRLLEF